MARTKTHYTFEPINVGRYVIWSLFAGPANATVRLDARGAAAGTPAAAFLFWFRSPVRT